MTKANVMLTHQFESALVYATQLHGDQRRKGGKIPYIAHLLSVAALVLEDGGSETEVIAALLHDAVEDQGGVATREEIRCRFGEKVVAIVDGCTESETVPKPPWPERRDRYINQLRHASPEVRRVSLADKLHNARSLLAAWRQEGTVIWTRFSQERAEVLQFYRSLLGIYREGGSDFMVEELHCVVSELEQLSADES